MLRTNEPEFGLIRIYERRASGARIDDFTPPLLSVSGRAWRFRYVNGRLWLQRAGAAASRRALRARPAAMARGLQAQHRGPRRHSCLRSLDVTPTHRGDCRTYQRTSA